MPRFGFFFPPPADFSAINGRRESQGSLSSGASLELGTSGSGKIEVGLSAGSPRNRRVSMNLSPLPLIYLKANPITDFSSCQPPMSLSLLTISSPLPVCCLLL